MFLIGFVGIWHLNGFDAAKSLLASETFTLASSPELIVVPLFILMGNVASVTGMSRKLYDAAYAMIGQIRGGLASATVLACGGFAALSGSSVASALTMGKVSLAQMDRFNYDPRLATGVVAAGGTLRHSYSAIYRVCDLCDFDRAVDWAFILGGCIAGHFASDDVRSDGYYPVLAETGIWTTRTQNNYF